MRLVAAVWALGLLVTFCQGAEDPSCVDSEVMCAMYCENGFKKDARGCTICECEVEICRDVQCAVGKICIPFSLTHSGHKISRCVDPTLPDNCQPPMDTGPCRGALPRFFYDTESDGCLTFKYGGCQGNDNNFNTMDECHAGCVTKENACDNDMMCALYCEHGFKKDARCCAVCECASSLAESVCDEAFCAVFCNYGFEKDERGCDKCVCLAPPEDECSSAPINCRMTCKYGFNKDGKGCDVCDCAVSGMFHARRLLPPGCKDMAVCDLYCEDGFLKDNNGCDQCECRSTKCPDVTCDLFCDYGFERNADGCDICECRPKCPDVLCAMKCDNGFSKDQYGCDVCICRPKSECNEVMCQMYCENGFQKNLDGCDVCRCNDQPSCDSKQCRMFCEFGFEKDARGCEICSCKEDPCLAVDCEAGQRCTVENKLPVCVDDGEHTWCSKARCRKFCENGFKSNELGCEICKCLDTPKPQCLTEVTCALACDYGFKFDEYGCRLCECLDDPCKDKSCDGDSVCEQKEPDCPFCPSVGQCIGYSQVQRIKIELYYSHDSVEEVDIEILTTTVRHRMSYLLGIDEEYIRGVEIQPINPTRTIVVFHVVSFGTGDIVQNYRHFENEIRAHQEGTALGYEDLDFVPEHRSLSASYYRNPYFEYSAHDDDDDNDNGSMGVIIGCSIAGGLALVLLIVVIVFIVKSKKQRKPDKSHIAYKKAPESQPKIVNDVSPNV